MSTSYIVNTAFNDVGKVMQVPDQAFDAITGVVNIAIALIILISVNVYIGILALILYIISMYALDKNMKKKNYYLSRQRKHQDNISSLMGQVLDGNKEIKAFNMSDNLNTYLKNYKKLWKKDYLKKRKYNDNFDV